MKIIFNSVKFQKMSSTATRLEVPQSFGGTFRATDQPQVKNAFKLNSSIANSEASRMSNDKLLEKNNPSLPINFFHSPAEYNKMLIRCSAPQKSNPIERKMGLIKNLQFINEPLFQREKEKRNERVRDYCQEMRKRKGAMSESGSIIKACTCCCCDKFCQECSKKSTCDFGSQEKECKSSNMLIDIEAMKKGVKKRSKRKQFQTIEIPSMVLDPHLCCKKSSGNFNIDQLITESLLKQIEKKREKQLSHLSQRQRKEFKHKFNEVVRETNRARSVSKSSRNLKQPKSLPKSKKQLGNLYWDEVKDMVASELKKEKLDKSSCLYIQKQFKQEEYVCLKKSRHNLSKQQMQSMRISHGKKAIKQEKSLKVYEAKLQRMKAKRLLALAAKQQQLIKTNPKNKFKPTKEMVENAFKKQFQ